MPPQAVLVGVESFLYEVRQPHLHHDGSDFPFPGQVTEEVWLDLACLVLEDPVRKISLQAYSQPTTVEARWGPHQ